MFERSIVPKKHWTDEEIEELSKMWHRGTARPLIMQKFIVNTNQLSRAIRDFKLGPRNAASAVHARPARTPNPPKEPKGSVARTKKSKTLIATPEPVIEESMPDWAVSVAELSDSVCRWPIGEPTLANFRFCGRNVRPPPPGRRKSPYCEAHRFIASDRRSKEQRVEDAIRAKGKDATLVFP